MSNATGYRNPTLAVDDRVEDLLAQMTVDEKIGQLGSIWVYEVLEKMAFSATKAAPLLAGGLGQVTRMGGASSLAPVALADLANQIQKYLLEQTRLGIPAIVHEECCSGYMARNATCFPQMIGAASTWEPELVEAMTGVIRTQMRAVGAHQGLSPILDIARDPRWGRTEETFGEDPYLVARMGVAYVRGLQGQDLHEGVMATGKHFAGYGVSEGGMNWAPPHLNPRELREVYLMPFEAAVKEGKLASMMNGYHEVDGIPCGSNRALLTDLLRGEWGFDGIVVSDYFAINQLFGYHEIAASKEVAAVMALQAGLDVELPGTDCYGDPLRRALESGLLSMDVLDLSVRRVLRMKFLLGLFEQPFVDVGRVPAVFDTSDQRVLARDIARKSMILLKNDQNLLPLPKTIGTLAVIGPNADSVRNLVGDYAYPCHIETLVEMQASGNVFNMPKLDSLELVDNFVPIKSILQVLHERLGSGVDVRYAQGCDVLDVSTDGFAAAVATAQAADVAILVMGDRAGLTDPCTTGEARDRAELGLPGVQEELVKAVLATGTPVVLVLVTGRPAAIPWISEHAQAIVEAWLPGEEGAEAVVDVLFGDYNPGGKMPITTPRGVGQIPIYYGHKASGGRSQWKGAYVEMSNKPLYPFGFGLSYTTFALENLQLDRTTARAGETFTVSVDVTNTGARAGDEVVQVYIRFTGASVTRPVKELKGFQRLQLADGERKNVRFTLAVNQCAYLDEDMRLVVEPGTIEVMVGTSSEELPLRGAVAVEGEVAQVKRDGAFFCQVEVV